MKLVKASVGPSVIEDLVSGRTSFNVLAERGNAFDNVTKVCYEQVIDDIQLDTNHELLPCIVSSW